MPNNYLDSRDRWLALSEIDYLGHFVRAWLALNAWYRGAYDDNQDREIVNNLKWRPNAIRGALVPLLSGATPEAIEFRLDIGLLHQRLTDFRIEVGKGVEKKPISFKEVYLKSRPVETRSSNHQAWNYEVKQGTANGSVESSARNRNGILCFSLIQQGYNISELQANNGFKQGLTSSQQSTLVCLYKEFSPRLVVDVSQRSAPNSNTFKLGYTEFVCPPEELFAAVIEVVYQMRCALFHGELSPSVRANACYEPAYRLVRQFLAAIH